VIMRSSLFSFVLLAAAALVAPLILTSCGGGGGGSGSQGLPKRVLDLETGVLGPLTRNVGSAPALGLTKIVFVEIPAGSLLAGQSAGTLGQQADETPGTSVAVPTFLIAQDELTQAQWLALVGTGDRPWLRLAPVGVTGSSLEGDRLPATGLTFDAITDALVAWNADASVTLGLPTNVQWEYACRAGISALFAWGDSVDPAVVARYAHVAAVAPATIGTRQANRFGLHDMHGNAREWTAAGELRGGGFSDHVLRARCANHLDGVDISTQHALSGVRLILMVP